MLKMYRSVGFAALLFAVALGVGFMFQDGAAAAAGTRSWIDAPLNGSNLPLAAVEVVSHSTNPGGISKVELSVDGAIVGTAANSDMGQTLLVARMEWKPSAPGNYTIMVRAQDSSGNWGSHAKSVVTIAGIAQTITPTVTPKTTVTSTPTATPTGVPPSPTATATPSPETGEPPADKPEEDEQIDAPPGQRVPPLQRVTPIPGRQVTPVRRIPSVQPVVTLTPTVTATPTATAFRVLPNVETVQPRPATATPTPTMRGREGPVIIPPKATATPTSGTGPRIMVPGGQTDR